jgi:hypothetical protein
MLTWRWSAATQGATRAAQVDTMSGAQLVIDTERVRFGLQGSPCGAWAHEEADGWY